MLKSLVLTHTVLPQLLIIENSSTDTTRNILKSIGIPFHTPGTITHSKSIDYALTACKTKYALMVDTDIIFVKNITPIFDVIKSMDMTLAGHIQGSRGGKILKKRVAPWFCFVNVEHTNKHNIRFFDESRLGANVNYDVGSSFFEDVKRAGLRIGDGLWEPEYFIHFEGMSWHTQTFDPSQPDTDIDRGGTHPHRGIYNHGVQVRRHYDSVTKYLSCVDIGYKFV